MLQISLYEDKLREVSDLEKFGAILSINCLKDIFCILGRLGIDMQEKDKFLEQVKEMSKDEEVLASMKFEDNMDYRFNLVEEDALKRGIEQNTINVILSMLKNDASFGFVSKVTGKSIEEIKEIADSIGGVVISFLVYLVFFFILGNIINKYFK